MDKVPTIFLRYTREEVEYGVVVVRVGERNFAVGISRGEEVLQTTREGSFVGLVRVVDNIAKRALNNRLNMKVQLNVSRESIYRQIILCTSHLGRHNLGRYRSMMRLCRALDDLQISSAENRVSSGGQPHLHRYLCFERVDRLYLFCCPSTWRDLQLD